MKKRKKPPVKKTAARKPIANPVFNCLNPEVAQNVELAFKCGNVEYFRFIDDAQMPVGRYKYVYEAMKEADMRMSLGMLDKFLFEMETELNGGTTGKVINIGVLLRLVINMRSRISLAFEPASIERLAAVMYFDKSEDLRTYNRQHGAQKVQNWKKHDFIDFFLTKPIVELLGLRGISETSLKTYLETAEQILKDLTPGTPTVLGAST